MKPANTGALMAKMASELNAAMAAEPKLETSANVKPAALLPKAWN